MSTVARQNRIELQLKSSLRQSCIFNHGISTVSPKHHRSHAVRLLLKICKAAKMDCEARSTSLQILDRFMQYSSEEECEDEKHLSMVVVCCAVLASKVLSQRSRFSLSSFPSLRIQDLLNLEGYILKTIEFVIVPQATPSHFMGLLISLLDSTAEERGSVMVQADNLIHSLCESDSYCQFSPSTLAIAALLSAMSISGIDSREWLEKVPDVFLVSRKPKPVSGTVPRDGDTMDLMDDSIESIESVVFGIACVNKTTQSRCVWMNIDACLEAIQSNQASLLRLSQHRAMLQRLAITSSSLTSSQLASPDREREGGGGKRKASSSGEMGIKVEVEVEVEVGEDKRVRGDDVSLSRSPNSVDELLALRRRREQEHLQQQQRTDADRDQWGVRTWKGPSPATVSMTEGLA